MSERARAWVERSCAEQGVPVKMTDPLALAKIADILSEARPRVERTLAQPSVLSKQTAA